MVTNDGRLSFLCALAPEVLASRIRWQHKEIKSIQITKEEIKLFLFTDDMIVCVDNLDKSTEKIV